ncbi:MAG: hypothetical protein RIC36_15280 [Rhodospirillales bacterium]
MAGFVTFLLSACGDSPAQTFADHIASGDYASAYAMTSEKFKELTSERRFSCAVERRGLTEIDLSDFVVEERIYGKSYMGRVPDPSGKMIGIFIAEDKEGTISALDMITLNDSLNVRFGSAKQFISIHMWPAGC